MGKTKKKKSKKQNNNFLTITAGIALGFILVFAIVAVDLFSKMGIISTGENNTDPAGFIEVTEAGEEGYIVETLEELRGRIIFLLFLKIGRKIQVKTVL